MDARFDRNTQLKTVLTKELLDSNVYVFHENGIEVDTNGRANKQIKVTDTELSVIKALLREKRGRFLDLNIFGNQFVCRLTVAGVLIGKLNAHVRETSHDEVAEMDATTEKAYSNGEARGNNEEAIATYARLQKVMGEKRIGNARRSRATDKPVGICITPGMNYVQPREITSNNDIGMKGQSVVDDTAYCNSFKHKIIDVLEKDRAGIDLTSLAEDLPTVHVKQSMSNKAVNSINEGRNVSSYESSCHTDGQRHMQETFSSVPKITINDTTEWVDEAGQNTDNVELQKKITRLKSFGRVNSRDENKRNSHEKVSGIALKDICVFVAAIFEGYTVLICTTAHNEISALEYLKSIKHALE
ncbi:hypothetical protein DPMN_139531 [Dreissena polymorpha]|uniref:Uncharacterized protein n=1 Tax=Dreissena polymorpha TaxID=45954 RepID=A0A9D4G638_DREPO|nr:hypothetical protein DPMN_139531 [Dreissena polymorpha]